MAIYVQDFLVEVLELVIKLLSGIRVSIETMLDHLTGEAISSLLGSIMSLILRIPRLAWVAVNVTEGSDTVNTAYHNFTGAAAENSLSIVGPVDGTSGITYMLNGTLNSGNSDIGPKLLTVSFDLIAALLVAMADFAQDLPAIFPWG